MVDKLEGTLIIGIRVNVPEVGSNAYFKERGVMQETTIASIPCSEVNAIPIARWWKDQNGDRAYAIWNGPREL